MSIKVTNSSGFPHVVYDIQFFFFFQAYSTRHGITAVEWALNPRKEWLVVTMTIVPLLHIGVLA